MAKSSQKNSSNDSNNNNQSSTTSTTVTKVKRTRRSVPRDSPPQRSSIYRGVTRHRWTGRYEAHLWDKNCWNESQNKKGRQVYLGAYDDEEAAAHAYDLAALKYWGEDTILNFPASTYEKEIKEMEAQSREEYIGSLRRKSSGFSRGVSKYRGVARHHHNGRWEARIGRVFGNKYLYLGTYATQEEAATAYDMAAIEYRGLNAVTNFDLSRYIKWLKPNTIANNSNDNSMVNINPTLPNLNYNSTSLAPSHKQEPAAALNFFRNQPSSLINHGESMLTASQQKSTIATSALGLLLQSSKFKEMMEMTDMTTSTVADQFVSSSTQPADDQSELPQCSFPKDIQTYFACDNSTNYSEGDEFVFGDLNSFNPAMFQCDFEA